MYIVAGFLCVLYIVYAIRLFFLKKVNFDWHLINGHFLLKVCCLAILTPSFLTLTINCSHSISTPTELVDTKTNKHLTADSTQIKENPNLYWTIYYHFIAPGNQHMTTSKNGRVWADIIETLGIFLLGGLLVTSMVSWVDRRKEKWMKGEIRYSKVRYLGKNKFAVVIGANEIVSSVIKNLLKDKDANTINHKCKETNNYVILQTSRNVQDVRTELASHLSEEMLKKVIIYKALRDSKEEIKKLHIEYCTEIYVLGENSLVGGEEPFHDTMNMKCVNLIANTLKESQPHNIKKKVCNVMFEYQTTYPIFQFSDIPKDVKEYLDFTPFNRYESWARELVGGEGRLITNKKEYTPLDGNGIKEDSEEHVHLIIVGMSKMGIAMGIQAMLQAHYMNFSKAVAEQDEQKKNNTRTRITFIDTKADKEMAFFKGRFENLFGLMRHRYVDANQCNAEELIALSHFEDPMETSCKWRHLSNTGTNFIDIELEFIKGELESEGVRQYLRNISDNNVPCVKNSKLTIAICLTQTHQAIAASLYMPISIYDKVQEIWVYQQESDDIVRNLISTESTDKYIKYKKIRPFGMLYDDYMSDRKHYLKAILVNAAYDDDVSKQDFSKKDMTNEDSYQDLLERRKENEKTQEFELKGWNTLSLDKKFSNYYYVDSICQKIRSVTNDDFTINDSDNKKDQLQHDIKEKENILAICEHNRWNVQQLIVGYSPCPKDIDDKFKKLVKEDSEEELYKLKKACKEGINREHPNICDYSHLDEVDPGAKTYDKDINNKIAEIIKAVDFN